MSEKPRLADESILTKDFLSKIGLEGLVIGSNDNDQFFDRISTRMVHCLAARMLLELFVWHVCFMDINCKSDHPVIFTKGLFHNKWLQGAFVLGYSTHYNSTDGSWISITYLKWKLWI